MTSINLLSYINAPINICFNLSRSAELHLISTAYTNERVVQGRFAGLFELGDTVTWRGKHFGIYQSLEMKISKLEFPTWFQDKMVRGTFKSISHDHYFSYDKACTVMTDVFNYEVPFGFLGKIFDHIVLKYYLMDLLKERNRVIKEYAESGKWTNVLPV